MQNELGEILRLLPHKEMGVLRTSNGQERVFFFSDTIPTKEKINVGSIVSYEPLDNGGRHLRAKAVRFVEKGKKKPLVETTLKEIAGWKLSAQGEDTNRYFFNTDEVTLLENGQKCYVVGRKGTGKTAISNHLISRSSYNFFPELLSFKSFPFELLYSLTDKTYTQPNQYITIWKYLIYSSVLKKMAEDESVDFALRRELQESYRNSLPEAITNRIKHLTNNSFKFNVFGTGIEIGKDVSHQNSNSSWPDRVALMESAILDAKISSKYFVIFDELHEDYQGAPSSLPSPFWPLITSLFKAVQDVKTVMSRAKQNIFPIIFVRDDIYDQIQDADKNKWSDYMIWLSWRPEVLQDLVGWRLARAKDRDAQAENMTFKDSWGWISNVDSEDGFYKILQKTHYRPRDFVKYLSVCAKYALQHNKRIDNSTLDSAAGSYSWYLRKEIIDEAYPLLPDINAIFDVFADLGKIHFLYEEFERVYKKHLNRKLLKTTDIEHVLRILFQFSVIGHKSRTGRLKIFQFRNPSVRFLQDQRIYVHEGLYSSLFLI